MRVFGILFAVLLAGCASQADIDSWQGASFDELVMTFGPPDKSANLEDGRRLVEFSHNVTTSTYSSHNYATGATNVHGGLNYHCRLRYMISPDGKVESGKAIGNIGGCNKLIQARN